MREEGQTVTEQLIATNPDINLIYAHNDEMALGAVAALQAAGVQPGDVKIITIDGTQGAVQGILDGWVSGVIESNPRFGPLAFKALDDFYSGEGVPAKTIIGDKEYTKRQRRGRAAERLLDAGILPACPAPARTGDATAAPAPSRHGRRSHILQRHVSRERG